MSGTAMAARAAAQVMARVRQTRMQRYMNRTPASSADSDGGGAGGDGGNPPCSVTGDWLQQDAGYSHSPSQLG